MQRAMRAEAAHVAERSEYRLYFLLAYPLFFAATLIIRLVRVSNKAMHGRRASVFTEAADRTHGAIPWVFSGR